MMGKAQHTPGPWFVDDDGELFVCPADAEAPIIATLVEQGDAEEPHLHGSEWYNAHLIAAAPDLLLIASVIASIDIAAFGDDAKHHHVIENIRGTEITIGLVKAARAAIAKAEGRS